MRSPGSHRLHRTKPRRKDHQPLPLRNLLENDHTKTFIAADIVYLGPRGLPPGVPPGLVHILDGLRGETGARECDEGGKCEADDYLHCDAPSGSLPHIRLIQMVAHPASHTRRTPMGPQW